MANKLGWCHDGTTYRVASDDVVVLETPFIDLSATPPTQVCRDPATGLPAYCPQPVQPASAPVPTPPAPVMVSCVDTRCGAALACTQRLESQYQNYQLWINAAVGAVGTASIAVLLNWLDAFLVGLEAAGQIAASVLNIFNGIRPLLALVSGTAISGVLPSWDVTTTDNVQRVFFAALQCTETTVSITQGDLNNIAGYIRANTASFLGNIVSELLGLICDYSALADWQAAVNRSTSSGLCAGY